jgi:hypothetical protein
MCLSAAGGGGLRFRIGNATGSGESMFSSGKTITSIGRNQSGRLLSYHEVPDEKIRCA